MTIRRHRVFDKQMDKLDKPMQRKVFERAQLLAFDPFHPLLNNHKLHHPYDGYSSINITGDWRVVYRKVGPNMYELRAVGTHHQLFGT
jgi:mRNA-degrading endonuclease YafQ of YafQ-DinJ toxin-antitoxin module